MKRNCFHRDDDTDSARREDNCSCRDVSCFHYRARQQYALRAMSGERRDEGGGREERRGKREEGGRREEESGRE